MGLLDDAIREHLDLKRKRGADPGEIERLEREALGPVRREPRSITAEPVAHMETIPEHDLFDEHGHDDAEDLDFDSHPTEMHQQLEEPAAPEPRRGFLRRGRSAPAADTPDDFTKHLDDVDDDGLSHLHGDAAPDDLLDTSPEPVPQADARPEPPPLTFDSPPPERPRFSSAPPAHQEQQAESGAAAEAAAHQEAAPTEPEAHEPDETTEWSVEAAFAAEDGVHTEPASPQPEPPAAPGHSEPAAEPEEEPVDEDVLEETPEFLQDTPDHDRLWFEQRPPRDFDFDG